MPHRPSFLDSGPAGSYNTHRLISSVHCSNIQVGTRPDGCCEMRPTGQSRWLQIIILVLIWRKLNFWRRCVRKRFFVHFLHRLSSKSWIGLIGDRTARPHSVQQFGADRVQTLETKRVQRKNAASFSCDVCGHRCALRIGLYAHRRTHLPTWVYCK